MGLDNPALRGARLQPGWLMFCDCTPALRLFTGPHSFRLGPSGPDAAGGLYEGLGIVVNVPPLTIPLNGTFTQHIFSISGISAEAMAAANVDRDTLRGARIAWARMEIDEHQNPIDEPTWLWQGFVDSPRTIRDGTTTPPTRTIALVTASGSVRRRIRTFNYWTGPQQHARDPDDTSCDLVSTYAAGTDEIWPA